MDKIRILLCCGAGMSSGFLAQQMRIAAKNSVQDDVNAIDLLLLGPHLEYVKAEMTQLCEPYHVPVIVIPKEMYAGLDGKGLMELSMEAIKKNKGEFNHG